MSKKSFIIVFSLAAFFTAKSALAVTDLFSIKDIAKQTCEQIKPFALESMEQGCEDAWQNCQDTLKDYLYQTAKYYEANEHAFMVLGQDAVQVLNQTGYTQHIEDEFMTQHLYAKQLYVNKLSFEDDFQNLKGEIQSTCGDSSKDSKPANDAETDNSEKAVNSDDALSAGGCSLNTYSSAVYNVSSLGLLIPTLLAWIRRRKA